MEEAVADLDQQVDADASPVEALSPGIGRDPGTGRFVRENWVDDSIDTSPIPVEAEADPGQPTE